MAWFQTFPSTKVSDEIEFQNASKRQIKIIYFYVTKTPPYKIIAGDSQIHIISNLGLGRRLYHKISKVCARNFKIDVFII